MPDVHSKEARSRNMAAIRSKNTKPELMVRRILFARGFRYRLHKKDLPGRPDIVLPKHRALVFVHGCFFHGHECPTFKWPLTRQRFWKAKIDGNRLRDERALELLRAGGWRTLVVWECAVRGSKKLQAEELGDAVSKWITSARGTSQIPKKNR
jgi:DNA mismatch endonuclease, patch repair protein